MPGRDGAARRCAGASWPAPPPPTCSASSRGTRASQSLTRRRRRRARRRAADRRARGARRARARRRARPGCSWSRWAGSAGGEMGYASDADVLFVHDPRRRAPTRRAAQEFALARRDRGCGRCSATVGPGAGARGRRRPAARGAQRPAGALVRLLRRVLRALVVAVGEPGAAARAPGRRRRRARGAVRARSSTRCATRPAGIDAAAVREVRRIKARVEAERLPARRRPRAAPQARARRASPTSSGPPSSSSSSTRTRCPALRTTGDARRARRRDRGRPARRRRRGACSPRRGCWPRGSGTRSCSGRGRAGGAHADVLPHDRRALAGLARVRRLPGRAPAASSRRTTCAPPAGPAPSSSASSTAEPPAAGRRAPASVASSGTSTQPRVLPGATARPPAAARRRRARADAGTSTRRPGSSRPRAAPGRRRAAPNTAPKPSTAEERDGRVDRERAGRDLGGEEQVLHLLVPDDERQRRAGP